MNRNPTPRTKSLDELHRIGSFRKSRHQGQRSPRATPGRPVKPDSLGPVASAAWDEAVTALDDMAILHTVDGLALTQYARLYGETEGIRAQQDRYRATVDKLESTLDGLTGGDLGQAIQQIAGLAKLDSKCTDQVRNGRNAIRLYLVEFGLTPASRNRIRLPDDAPEAADPFAALAGQRPA